MEVYMSIPGTGAAAVALVLRVDTRKFMLQSTIVYAIVCIEHVGMGLRAGVCHVARAKS